MFNSTPSAFFCVDRMSRNYKEALAIGLTNRITKTFHGSSLALG